MKKHILFILLPAILAFADATPKFQAFAPSFFRLSKVSDGYHNFTLKVDVAPWAFVYEGKVKAPNGDPYVLPDGLDADEVFIVVAYVPSPVVGSDGKDYQAGLCDIMIYYTDEADELQATIQDAKVHLLPPIAGNEWAQGALKGAPSACGTPGAVWSNPRYTSDITETSADPLDRNKLLSAQKTQTVRQKKAQSGTTVQARESSTAENTSPVVRKKRRRTAVVAVDESSDDDADLTPKERKKRAVLAKRLEEERAMRAAADSSKY